MAVTALTTTELGFFTSVHTTTFGNSPARIVVYETRSGLHGNAYQAQARPLEFLFSYRLGAEGTLRYEPPTGAFSGTW